MRILGDHSVGTVKRREWNHSSLKICQKPRKTAMKMARRRQIRIKRRGARRLNDYAVEAIANNENSPSRYLPAMALPCPRKDCNDVSPEDHYF